MRAGNFATRASTLLLASATLAAGSSRAPVQLEKRGRIERIVVHGQSLERNLGRLSADRAVLVYLPPSYDANRDVRYPSLYLLHGASETGHLLWTGSLADVQQIADRVLTDDARGRGVIIVMPDASSPYLGTLYSNSVVDGKWEDFIAGDLVKFIDSRYRTIARRDSRGIAGHSRGGYGALRLAMLRSDVFSAVYALSPCCTEPEADPPRLQSAHEIRSASDVEAWRRRQPFGSPISVLAQAAAWSPNAHRPPLYLDLPSDLSTGPVAAKWHANSLLGLLPRSVSSVRKLRAIAFDVGDQDRAVSISGIVGFDSALTAATIRHTYELYPGTHVSRVPERLETKMLPFFLNELSGATSSK
jgi:S-formylglutathione hydrolase FrmB